MTAAANSWINLSALWRIIVVGLLCGAGLPALFAVGLRALSLHPAGTPGDPSSEKVYAGNPLGLAAAVACFAVVLAGIAWGVYMVVES